MPEAALHFDVEQLNVHYGQCHAVRDAQFSASAGEVLGVLGRNGAGKSTCVNAMAGLVRASSGAVRIDGKPLTNLAPVEICRAGVGLVPQGRRIFRSLTVDENLAVAERRGDGTARWTRRTIYELFPRLVERRTSMGSTLSGGEQQMLAIGRALAGNPRILLMDEPSEGLAPQIVAEVAACVERLRKEGLAIVLVEQNLRMAARLTDRLVVMSSGRIVFAGKTCEFVADEERVESHLGVRPTRSVQVEAA